MAKNTSKNPTRVTHSRHGGATRKNTPPAALAGEAVVPPVPKAEYAYSPRLDPVLRSDPTGGADRLSEILHRAQRDKLSADEVEVLRDALSRHEPWLEWAGKAEEEERGLRVDPVALHLHERVSAQAVLKVAARQDVERNLFADPEQAYHEAVQFYQHDIDWTNRLILGDSLQVMSSLTQRENLAGKVQMIYMDPPYGIKFGSNFQSSVGNRTVTDAERDLTREPEMVRAYRDTWHLGIHSYLEYLRDRLLVAHDLLADSGSIFIQISDENVHRVRQLMDEVFGPENFVLTILLKKKGSQKSGTMDPINDFILWAAKDVSVAASKFQPIFRTSHSGGSLPGGTFKFAEDEFGKITPASALDESVAGEVRFFSSENATAGGVRKNQSHLYQYEGSTFDPGLSRGNCWKHTAVAADGKLSGLDRMAGADRLYVGKDQLRFKRYFDDFGCSTVTNWWDDFGGATDPVYVVQTAENAVARCMLMTTDPGDLVVDPTCGSGTTAYVAEQWGRRWITMDTSRVALSLARQRMLTARFQRFQLEGEDLDEAAEKNGQGIDPAQNFVYRTIAHITSASVANNEALDPIFERHQPILDEKLAAVNEALEEVDDGLRLELATALAEKMQAEGLRAATDADRRRWLLPGTTKQMIAEAYDGKAKLKKTHVQKDAAAVPAGGRFEHWQVPFDADDDWPEALSAAVTAYRGAWRAKMDEVNACIDANAESETLVDKPEVVPGVVRVSGPFTVEAVQPAELTLGEEAKTTEGGAAFAGDPGGDGDLATWESREVEGRPELDATNANAYLANMLALLRADGVKFLNNKTVAWSRLEARDDVAGNGVHAEGRWVPVGEEDPDPEGEAKVAVVIGPQYGPTTSRVVVDAMRWALRRGYEDVLFAGFSFDAAAQAEIDNYADERIRPHLANIRPDLNPAMDGLLKAPGKPGEGQLFAVFGQPRIAVLEPDEDGLVRVKMEGVDVYDPVRNVLQSTGADKVACWLLDGDYDGQTFCVTQAFFPDSSAWAKLKKALGGKGGAVDDAAFKALSGTTSLPFAPGEHKRAAVKVIDPRGNEVMKVVGLP